MTMKKMKESKKTSWAGRITSEGDPEDPVVPPFHGTAGKQLQIAYQ